MTRKWIFPRSETLYIVRVSRTLMVTALIAGLAFGCGKQSETGSGAAPASPDQTTATAPQGGGPPGPAPTPAAPQVIPPAPDGNIEATLAQLTRELHRTMIGRRLSGSFEEFVAVRNLQVPPPPAGKKYAISKQWRVVLVDK